MGGLAYSIWPCFKENPHLDTRGHREEVYRRVELRLQSSFVALSQMAHAEWLPHHIADEANSTYYIQVTALVKRFELQIWHLKRPKLSPLAGSD
jgi:hypothetical protein